MQERTYQSGRSIYCNWAGCSGNQTFYYCGAHAQENIVILFIVPEAIWKYQLPHYRK